MAVENYQWIPGCGPSATSLKRMRERIKKPDEPMGEAWFMSRERRLYSEMMEQDPLTLSSSYLGRVLEEIASGTKCFGHLEEWDQWFQFLLPALIERSHESWVLEDTLATFFNVFDNGITEIYDGFRDDVINSLSLCLMKSELWFDWVDEVTKMKTRRPRFLFDFGITRGWNFQKTSAEVSISLFFCLKYLRPEEIAGWVKSLAAINDPFWQAHLLVWLVGFNDFINLPSTTWQRLKKAAPNISWGYADPIEPASDKRDFLPEVNVQAFLDKVRQEINSETLFRWIDSFSHRPILKETLWDIPDIYFDKFISPV
jgi:hypothetical protein